MQKRGQLGFIEFKYFISGLLFGLFGGFVLTYLGSAKIIPFKIPAICGAVLLNKKGLLDTLNQALNRYIPNKKAQLGIIEARYFMMGFVVGIIGSFILTYLGTNGTLGLKIPFVCG